MAKGFKVTMAAARETKGTVLYTAVDGEGEAIEKGAAEAKILAVYVEKAALPKGKYPKSVTVTFAYDEAGKMVAMTGGGEKPKKRQVAELED